MTKLTSFEKSLAKDLLECIARGQYSITYGDVTRKYDVDPHSRTVANALGQMSTLCYELGLPLISVVAVLKETNYPAEGFKGLCDVLNIHQDMNEYQLISFEQKAVRDCAEWWKLAEYLDVTVNGMEKPVSDPVEDVFQTEGIEGKLIQVNSTVYERNPKLREACLKKYGARCAICGFDAGEVYGSEFEGWIHVHHITALSEVKQEHKTVADTDLIPVCPNCHMILHAKKNGVYSPDEVRNMIHK